MEGRESIFSSHDYKKVSVLLSSCSAFEVAIFFMLSVPKPWLMESYALNITNVRSNYLYIFYLNSA